MLGVTFSSKLDWGSYIIYIAKSDSKKIGVLICSIKFFFLWLFCISVNLSNDYILKTVAFWNCWISCKNGYAELLILHLLHHLNPWLIAETQPAWLSLFYRHYFGRCTSELGELLPLPFSWGMSTFYSDKLHDFSVIIPRCYKDININSYFPPTARLWNCLPIKCFPLTYNCWLYVWN